ncbi:MAG: serine O-acetyltransferase [Nitrospinae bacterium]|nr:serine O-acetyltransferase [Nitrospinota bacterium]
MLKQIREDVHVALEKDPAARNFFEVLVCYPGVHALISHRIAHRLWNGGFKFLGRLLSFITRWMTGIEIHPAARIGRRFFIDHGMGVVIGETAEVGDNVFLYHGVTLGGISMKRGKRHPTIGNNVVIGAGAQVLGPIKIGDNTKIGSGSVVLQHVPEYSTVIGVPGRVVFSGVSAREETDDGQATFPDPVARAIECMLERLPQMEKEIRALKDALNLGEKKDPAAPQSPVPLPSMKKVSGGHNS